MFFGWAYEGGWTVANEDGSDEEGGHIVFAGDGVCILSIQVAHRSLRTKSGGHVTLWNPTGRSALLGYKAPRLFGVLARPRLHVLWDEALSLQYGHLVGSGVRTPYLPNVSVEVKGANTDVLPRSLSKDLAVTVIVIL